MPKISELKADWSFFEKVSALEDILQKRAEGIIPQREEIKELFKRVIIFSTKKIVNKLTSAIIY